MGANSITHHDQLCVCLQRRKISSFCSNYRHACAVLQHSVRQTKLPRWNEAFHQYGTFPIYGDILRFWRLSPKMAKNWSPKKANVSDNRHSNFFSVIGAHQQLTELYKFLNFEFQMFQTKLPRKIEFFVVGVKTFSRKSF